MVIRDCKVDEQLLEPFKECMTAPGIDPGEDEWPMNLLSHRAVVYSCGRLGRSGELMEHAHDAEEVALCRRLAQEAAAPWQGRWFAFSDEGSHQFSPFFATALVGDKVPSQVSEEHVRAAFGGTLRADCRIVIEPLAEAGEWWRLAGGEEGSPLLLLWRSTIAWFNQPGLHGASFVHIDNPPLGAAWGGGMPPCTFPRVVLALTERGSLVGMYSCVVWT
jgi:hypothetical protein